MQKLSKFIDYYLKNVILRNFSAIVIDLSTLMLLYYAVRMTFLTPIKDLNFVILALYILGVLALKKISIFLRITRVCPLCNENRGILHSSIKTGNTSNYCEYIKGDYWYHSQDVEYLLLTACHFCDYEVEEYIWKTESWQGDLTEEAKIRKNAEAIKKATKQAYIDAYDEIRIRR